jgi:hypothetical protein
MQCKITLWVLPQASSRPVVQGCLMKTLKKVRYFIFVFGSFALVLYLAALEQ